MVFPDVIEDEALRLEKLRSTDFELLYDVAKDPEIWEQHPQNDRYKREVFERFFDLAIQSPSAYKIWHKEANRYVGSSRYYELDDIGGSIAVGYTFIAKEFWGGTVNGRLKKLMLDWAFEYMDKVYFHVGAHNYRSQKAVKKLGAEYVSEVPQEYNRKSYMRLLYVLERNVWESQHLIK